MKCKLTDICEYRKGKVNVSNLTLKTYISTENMLPDKAGVLEANSLPSTALVQEYKENDILVSNIRPYFKKIWQAKYDGGCSNDVLVFQGNLNVDKDFLYYILANDDFFAYSMAISKGTKMPRGDKKSIMQYELQLFDIKIQKRIASILKVLDKKIELNNAINKNLLQQSLYIFETLINSTSKDGCIGDYCTLKSGFAFKSKWWQDSGIPVIKIGSINQDCLNLSNCSHVSEDKISLAKDFIVSGGDLLIAMTGATIGKFTMVPKMHKTILVNQRVGKFFLGENPINKIPFIYCTLKQPEIISEIINRGQGSAQPNISASDIMSIPCVIPKTDEINNFNLQTAPMFELIINNQFENLILAKTRDLLLPRLMSGEIDISNISF